MHKIKKGDLVKVIAGKDKDKTGKVLSVNVKKNTVLVEGCNMVTKHSKPSAANQQGGIIHQEGPIDKMCIRDRYNIEDIRQSTIIQSDLIPEEERTEYLCQTNMSLAKSPLVFQEHRLRRKDGSDIYVRCV